MAHSPFGRSREATMLLCLLLGLALGGPTAAAQSGMQLQDYEVGDYPLGGDFTLVKHDGQRAGLADYRGKVVLLAFGYTHCPDVCPTTLAEFQQVKRALGKDAERLQVVFITLDPARDTAEHLARYLSHFDPAFAGFTGEEDDVAQVAEAYMARYRKRKVDSRIGYLIDHTVFNYLIDPQGKVRYLFTPDAARDHVVAGARALMHADS